MRRVVSAMGTTATCDRALTKSRAVFVDVGDDAMQGNRRIDPRVARHDVELRRQRVLQRRGGYAL